MSTDLFSINVVSFFSNTIRQADDNKDSTTTIEQQLISLNLQLQNEIEQYKYKIHQLQLENHMATQKAIICQDALSTNTMRFKKQLHAFKLEFQQHEETNKIQHNKKLNTCKIQIQIQHNKIQKLEETIRKIQEHSKAETLKYSNYIKSLNGEIRDNNLKTTQMEKDYKDLELFFDNEISKLNYEIKRKDAEIHSLQMITNVKSYDINIVNPYNNRRKRSSAIRKISMTLDTIDANIQHQSQWKHSEADATPLFIKQRSNNGCIFVTSPSTESPFGAFNDGIHDFSNCFMETESKSNKRDERSQTC